MSGLWLPPVPDLVTGWVQLAGRQEKSVGVRFAFQGSSLDASPQNHLRSTTQASVEFPAASCTFLSSCLTLLPHASLHLARAYLSTVIQFKFFERHVYSSYPIPVPNVPDRFPTLPPVTPPNLHRTQGSLHYHLCVSHTQIYSHT